MQPGSYSCRAAPRGSQLLSAPCHAGQGEAEGAVLAVAFSLCFLRQLLSLYSGLQKCPVAFSKLLKVSSFYAYHCHAHTSLTDRFVLSSHHILMAWYLCMNRKISGLSETGAGKRNRLVWKESFDSLHQPVLENSSARC